MGMRDVMFSTMVNLAEVNGLGAMGNLGSEATKANCLPPPTGIESKIEIRSIESTISKDYFDQLPRHSPSGLKINLSLKINLQHSSPLIMAPDPV